FDPNHQITINQTFDAATTDAVDRWQSALGQTQTGTGTLGHVVFLPGPQRITQVSGVLGSNGSGSGSGNGTGVSATVRPSTEFVSLTKPVASNAASSTPPCTSSATPG